MKHQSAFTLPELLITLTIIAIVSTFAFPSLRSLMSKQDEKILQDTIIHSIQFAQDETIALSKPIALSLHQKNTVIVFADDYHDGVVHNHSQILTTQQINLLKGDLHIRSFPYYRSYLLFNGTSNDNATISFFEHPNASPKWAIILSQTGRVRITVMPAKECHPRKITSHPGEIICHPREGGDPFVSSL